MRSRLGERSVAYSTNPGTNLNLCLGCNPMQQYPIVKGIELYPASNRERKKNTFAQLEAQLLRTSRWRTPRDLSTAVQYSVYLYVRRRC